MMERTHLEQWKAREVARLLALVETERRYYQDIVASLPVGLLVLASDLSIVSSNRELRKIFGLRSGDPIRGRLDTLLPETVLDQVRDVLKTGNPQNNLAVHSERDGGKHLRVSIQSIRNWDDETEQEALVTIEDVSDISPPPLAALSSTKTQLDTAVLPASEVLGNLEAIVWAVELPSKQFLYVNEKAEELLGYPAEHWLKAPGLKVPGFWEERIHPEDREWVLESYDRAIENWSRHSCEYRAQTAYGRVVWLRETARLLLDQDGQTKHLIGIAVEVGQRRMLENQVIQSQRVDALGKLGNRVSNEINNLLMVVSGYGEELVHGLPASHPLHSDLQEILSATDRLRGLANQLSLFSRRPSAAPSPLDLGAFITRIEPVLKNALGDRILLDLKMFPATIGVHADPAHLEQLLTALAQRARREMVDGGKLSIECSHLEITEDLRRDEIALRPGLYGVIAVEDTGPTPDPEARAAIFESIATPREAKDDTDAILSRIYGFVRHWGGDISVSVNSPHGAVFEIFLPRVGESAGAIPPASPNAEPVEQQDPPEREREDAPLEPAPEPEPVQETILIAEEDAGIRALVKKILRRQNYTVLEAGSPDEALKAAAEHTGKIDLVITDVSAAQLDGEELAQKVMAQYPQARILYLSGYTDDPSAQAADVPDGAASLQKPFTLGSLLNKVREVLELQPESAPSTPPYLTAGCEPTSTGPLASESPH
ncbi:MAG: PAS domain-containing protein [Bryobacteraceae bacterium]